MSSAVVVLLSQGLTAEELKRWYVPAGGKLPCTL